MPRIPSDFWTTFAGRVIVSEILTDSGPVSGDQVTASIMDPPASSRAGN